MADFYFVPRHKLGEEVAEEYMAFYPEKVAAVYRGVDQPDPELPGDQMCQDRELSRAAMRAGQSLATACGVCDKSGKCGYSRQKNILADLWVLPHQLLFISRPTWLPEPVTVIVDEDFVQAGFAGFSNG
jgi:putative DNA primase/helicase